VLLSWADILVGSLANERTMPRVCMTVDLDVRVAQPLPVGARVHSVGRILKSGRSLTVGEADFFVDGGDTPAAHVVGGFMASPRPDDVADSFVSSVTRRVRRTATTPGQPLADLLGARIVAPGIVEAERQARILNWADTVQGGAVALLAEEAALSLAGAAVPNELQVRYLRAVRVGPMRATAERFGAWTRTVVTDAGAGDRVVALAVTRA
jgi:acyl-coenzyme A thioesterase PaaI-like protein